MASGSRCVWMQRFQCRGHVCRNTAGSACFKQDKHPQRRCGTDDSWFPVLDSPENRISPRLDSPEIPHPGRHVHLVSGQHLGDVVDLMPGDKPHPALGKQVRPGPSGVVHVEFGGAVKPSQEVDIRHVFDNPARFIFIGSDLNEEGRGVLDGGRDGRGTAQNRHVRNTIQ